MSAEWVREDPLTVTKTFPSPAGVYFFKVVEANELGGKFIVEPVLSVADEKVIVTGTDGMLMHVPVEGTLRIYELPGNIELKEGFHYTVNYETGEITLREPLDNGLQLSADYRYKGETRGPYTLTPNHSAPTEALPGAIVVFGRRYSLNDEFAVIVNRERKISARVFAGKWVTTYDIEVVARDVEEQEEILDQTAMYIYGALRARLGTEGIEVEDVTLGGEVEEIHNEEEESYYYSALMSVTLKSDWEIHVPLPVDVQRVIPVFKQDLETLETGSDVDVALLQSSIRVFEENGLNPHEDPYYTGKNSFERII